MAGGVPIREMTTGQSAFFVAVVVMLIAFDFLLPSREAKDAVATANPGQFALPVGGSRRGDHERDSFLLLPGYRLVVVTRANGGVPTLSPPAPGSAMVLLPYGLLLFGVGLLGYKLRGESR